MVMTDRELAQATFAMRIFDHDVDISYSTREPASIRDHMASCVTTMSAESKRPNRAATTPIRRHWNNSTSATSVPHTRWDAALRRMGREPVWKDWDASFDHPKLTHTA